MAISDSTSPTMTAACEIFARHGSCRGTLISFTDAHLAPCQCPCHGIVSGLPDAWKDQVAAYPPCDDDQELEQILDLEGDRLLENEWTGAEL
jgi:hypothetical protein